DRGIILYDLARPGRSRDLAGSPPDVTALAFDSTAGKLLAAGNAAGKVTVHDVEGGKLLLEAETAGVQALALRPDGEALAVAGADGRVQLLSVRAGKALGQLDVWPGGVIRQVRFSPDGRHLATVNGNHTAYVYRLTAAGKE